MKYKLKPTSHETRLFDKPSLFAIKIHDILYRGWKNKVRGKDLYDYIFFIANDTKVNMNLIKNKLIESNFISKNITITLDLKKC